MFSMRETLDSDLIISPREAVISRLTDLLVSLTGRQPAPNLVGLVVDGIIEAASKCSCTEGPLVGDDSGRRVMIPPTQKQPKKSETVPTT